MIIKDSKITYYKLSQKTQFDRDNLNRIMLYLICQKFIKKITNKNNEELYCYKKAQQIIKNEIVFKYPVSITKKISHN